MITAMPMTSQDLRRLLTVGGCVALAACHGAQCTQVSNNQLGVVCRDAHLNPSIDDRVKNLVRTCIRMRESDNCATLLT